MSLPVCRAIDANHIGVGAVMALPVCRAIDANHIGVGVAIPLPGCAAINANHMALGAIVVDTVSPWRVSARCVSASTAWR
jgi:hypothetical protein